MARRRGKPVPNVQIDKPCLNWLHVRGWYDWAVATETMVSKRNRGARAALGMEQTMSEKKPTCEITPLTAGLDRRAFLQGSLATLAALVLGNSALASAMDVRVTPEPAEPTPLSEAEGLTIKPRPVDPIAKPFLDEKTKIDITFMGAKLAEGSFSFKRISNWSYEATIESRITGAVGPLIKHRQQVMKATMLVKKVGGRDRFVTTEFYRKTVTTEKTVERKHEFNYYHRRWVYTRTEAGKPPKVRTRDIAANRYYDDFCCILYNARAQVYAPFGSGKVVVVHTIPWTNIVEGEGGKKKYRSDSMTLVFPKKTEIVAADQAWMKANSAEVMLIAKLDPDAYGIKSGQAKFLASKTGRPIAGWAKDVMFYGDVRAEAHS